MSASEIVHKYLKIPWGLCRSPSSLVLTTVLLSKKKKKKSTPSKTGWVTERPGRLVTGCLTSSRSQHDAEGAGLPKAIEFGEPDVSPFPQPVF